MRKTLLCKHLVASILFSILIIGASVKSKAQCHLLNESFNTPPVLAETNTNGAWYPDRYRPAGFTSTAFGSGNVLKISIDGVNDGLTNRPPAYQISFYNTQGRKFNQCGGCVTVLRGELYIPSDWATKHRRSDMWATAYDATNTISAYPIIGFRNPDGFSPGIYYWDGHLNSNNGGWVNSGVSLTYNSWYHLQFRIVAGNFEFLVNNTIVGTISADGSTYFGDIIMQAYNFNDPTLPAINQSSDSYNAYWDNLVTTGTGGNVVTNTSTGLSYCSIQGAINDPLTVNGNTIVVGPGTYNENVIVNKSLTFNGAQVGIDARTRSGAESSVNGGGANFTINADNVTVDGFTLTSPASSGSAAIVMPAGNIGETVKNNIINNPGRAVSFNTSNTAFRNNLVNNIFASASDGFQANTSPIHDVTVSDNTFGGANGNIYNADITIIEGSSNVIVSGNTSNGDGTLIAVFKTNNSQITGNIVTGDNNSSAIYIGGGNNGATVSGNTVTSAGTGVNVANVFGDGSNSNVFITGNDLYNNTTGIKVGATAVSVAGTVVANNNSIIQNSSFGFNNLSTFMADATCNWWGSVNGPTNASNPGGSGDRVSDKVNFTPWLLSKNGACGGGTTKNNCQQIVDQKKKDFDAQQKSDKATFDAMQKTQKDNFNAQNPHPTPQQKKTFDDMQQTDKKNFDAMQQAAAQSFNQQNDADKKACEQLCDQGQVTMCHDGKTECVPQGDVDKHLAEKGNHWMKGSCSAPSSSARTEYTEISVKPELVPVEYKLSNYPNPFVGTSTIRYDLPYDSKVSIKVYDVMGREVTTLVNNEDKKAGSYTIDFNASHFTKGSLYYRIIAKSSNKQFEQTNKMIQLK